MDRAAAEQAVANVIDMPLPSKYTRSALKAEYHASLRSTKTFWAVVEADCGLYVGRVESVNPDHGDIVLNSVERVDVSLTANKLWIRGSQVRQVVFVDPKSKDRAVAVAKKMLPAYLSRRGRGEEL